MDIEQEIAKIKDRNSRVEKDKTWEVSFTRKVTICVITYTVVLIYNLTIASKMSVWLTSAVPVIGYFISTLSLPLARKMWEVRNER